MGWIKQANKIGEYYSTYLGFRIYKANRIYIAINKDGVRVECPRLEGIGFEIDIADAHEYYKKQDAKQAKKDQKCKPTTLPGLFDMNTQ